MKTKITTSALFLLFSFHLFANGVGIINAQNGIYLKLTQSSVRVDVESQVAITASTQLFQNILTTKQVIKYAFPMPDGASAVALEWKINGSWRKAIFSATPQDTTVPGGTMAANLRTYLGKTPLFFSIPDTLRPDSVLEVKLTYVQLLKYSFGNVEFVYPNNYALIQTAVLGLQELTFNLTSPRTIDSIKCLSHTPQSATNTGHSAFIKVSAEQQAAADDYRIRYTLNASQLGLFSYSTSMADSLLPDTLGKGFFLFIAEPDPNASIATIRKVFTIIIDRSGSMSGLKIQQAKGAATYIVNNLNEGDRFNVIDFDDIITSFKPSHVPFTSENKQAALAYIAALTSRGSTNIAGAFQTAIPQFAGSSDSSAKIIIFLTDGLPTAGITTTAGILSAINTAASQTDTNISVFCFGVGADVDKQLLTLIATQHHGLADFILNEELEAKLIEFYNKIRNPVLLAPRVLFDPANVKELYPILLPNIYKGQQLFVSGRYTVPGAVNVTLQGNAFGHPVSYSYPMSLIDSTNSSYLFLTKVWAKLKIEYLLVEYYKLNPDTPAAAQLKASIIKLSMAYGVLSPFTSFTGGATGIEEKKNPQDNPGVAGDFRIVGNYPNPFNPSTKILFFANGIREEVAVIRIYSVTGELLRTLIKVVNSDGTHEVEWDGKTDEGAFVPSGNYIYVIAVGNRILASKMALLK